MVVGDGKGSGRRKLHCRRCKNCCRIAVVVEGEGGGSGGRVVEEGCALETRSA